MSKSKTRLTSGHSTGGLSLLIVDHTGTPGGGQLGAARYLRHKSRFERSLLLLEDGPLSADAAAADIHVTVLGKKTGKWGVVWRLGQLRKALRSSDSEVVIANSLKSAILLACVKVPGKKYFYYLREGLSEDWLRGIKRWIVVNAVLPRYDGFLANSKWTASTIPAKLGRIPVRIAYPLSGVGVHNVPRGDNSSNEKVRILSLSRLSPWKGIHILLDALEILEGQGLASRLEVTIAGGAVFGENQYGAELTDRAKQLRSHISMPGHVKDVQPLLEKHDVLVSCSLSPEPFGQVVLQALSNELLVIATDQGGPKEILEHGVSGILVEAGNAQDLAHAIADGLARPDARRCIAKRGREVSTRFADQEMGELFDDSVAELATLTMERSTK